jgi:hypothetical protein
MICHYDRPTHPRSTGIILSVAVVVKASSTMFHLYPEIGGTSPHCKTGVESRGPPSFSRSLYSSFLCPPPTTCNHQHDCYLCRDSIYMYLLLLRVGSLRGLSKARHRFTYDTIQVSKLVSNTRLDPFYCNKNRLRTHLHFAFHHAISLHLLTRLSTFQKI